MAIEAQDSRDADFLGDGADLDFTEQTSGQARLDAAGLAEMRARKKAWLENQGLDENGNPLPAYGTPTSAGGTATKWETAFQPIGATSGTVWSSPTGSQGVAEPGAKITERTYVGGVQDPNSAGVVGTILPGQDLVGSMGATPGLASQSGMSVGSDGTLTTGTGTVTGAPTVGGTIQNVPGGGGRGTQLSGQTAQGTADLRAKLATDQAGAVDGLQAATADAAAMNPLTNTALTQTAGNQARSALGPAPTIDQGLADRGMTAVTDATRKAGQVVDAALAPVNQQPVMQAQQSARDVLDKALNGPDTTARIGAQTLRNQLALARSAAGGAGAAQQALTTAQAAAPELMAQAADAGIREQQAKLGVASQQTGQLAQTALGQQQNETQRLGTAAQAAGASAQAAQGARGQDIEIAKSNQASATNLLNNVAQLTGQQLQLNQQNQELIGQMARDLAAQKFDWSKLDAGTQDAEFERWVKTYGIDVAAAAQIRAAASQNDKGVMDYLMPIIGGVASGLL